MAKDGMATATKIGATTEDPQPEVTPEATPDPATAPAPADAPAETVTPAETPEPVTARTHMFTAERVKAIAKFIGLERWAKEARPVLHTLLAKEDASLSEEEKQILLEAVLTCNFVQQRGSQISGVLTGQINPIDVRMDED